MSEKITDKGTLQLAIMADLLNNGGIRKGYDIMQRFDVPSGSVYPSLGRLVDADILQEVDAPVNYRRGGGQNVKHYGFTPHGLLVAEQDLQTFQVPGLSNVVRLKLSQFGDRTSG